MPRTTRVSFQTAESQQIFQTEYTRPRVLAIRCLRYLSRVAEDRVACNFKLLNALIFLWFPNTPLLAMTVICVYKLPSKYSSANSGTFPCVLQTAEMDWGDHSSKKLYSSIFFRFISRSE